MTGAAPAGHRRRLRADCERCVGLCCVAPAFGVSADFALDKPAGVACPNLGADHRCGIHDQLRPQGFAGCAVYDCFGAGQQLTQVTFGGRSWRDDPGIAADMFDAFAVMRDLHELLWYLGEAAILASDGGLHRRIEALQSEVQGLTAGAADALLAVDRDALRRRAGDLLLAVSAAVRGPTPAHRDLARADLIGRNLARRDLRGASLVGALLIAADLTGADLRGADLRSADLRGADLAGADLRDCLFLLQVQVDAARGDRATRLPRDVTLPGHWAPSGPGSGRPRP